MDLLVNPSPAELLVFAKQALPQGDLVLRGVRRADRVTWCRARDANHSELASALGVEGMTHYQYLALALRDGQWWLTCHHQSMYQLTSIRRLAPVPMKAFVPGLIADYSLTPTE